jgi:hypothetical protein
MKKKLVAAGLVAALGATALAADLIPWNKDTIAQANNLFHDRSGIQFTTDPPDPEHPEANQVLRVHAAARDGITQWIAVTSDRPDPAFPPGPCFKATFTDPPDPEKPSVVVHVLHPSEVKFVDANGAVLHLSN